MNEDLHLTVSTEDNPEGVNDSKLSNIVDE
jgi:hypothetical protein